MIVERFEKFDKSFYTSSGDKFSLSVDGKMVHSMSIKGIKIISHWACVTMGENIGYFIGGPELEQQLKDLGAKFSKKSESK